MRLVFASILFSLSVLIYSATANSAGYVPLYVWSGSHASGNHVISEARDFATARSLLLPKDNTTPKVVLAFIQDSMSSKEAMEHRPLNRAISTAVASKGSSTFVDHFAPETNMVELLAKEVGIAAQSISLGSTCKGLTTWVKSQVKGGRAQKSVFLVVRSNDPAVTASCIDSSSSVVHDLTNGNYLSLFTSLGSSPSALSLLETGLHVHVQASTSLGAGGAQTTGPQFVNSTIVLALFAVFFVLTILVTALMLLTSIETPVRFGYQNLAISKEY